MDEKLERKNKMLESFGINTQGKSDEEVDAFYAKIESEKKREEKAMLETNYVHYSGIPDRYKNESLETYKPTEENKQKYERLKTYVDVVSSGEAKRNLCVISGEYGTGKTHLACGIIRQLGGRIVTSLEMCLEYDSCRDFKAEKTRIQYLHELCANRVLVIDELGKGERTIEKLILPYIVNDFYGSGRLLVLVGNITKSELDDIIGEAGADRMNESGIYFPLVGKSKRAEK